VNIIALSIENWITKGYGLVQDGLEKLWVDLHHDRNICSLLPCLVLVFS
jgi:hypothetical protein